MLDKIDSNNPKTDSIDLYKMEVDSYIDVSEDIQHPPVALSIGEYTIGQTIYPRIYGTYGNFSAIVGASKARKSFLKTMLIASYIGGQSSNYCNVKSHRDSDLYVLDFDTEQGDWHAQWAFKRVANMCGDIYDNYRGYALRKYDYKQRLEFIDWCINKNFKDKVGLVSIDGVADLVNDVNDLTQCNELIQKIMKWTQEGNFHLVTVLHSNFGSKKPTGHLGSAMLKKCETICELERQDEQTKVDFTYTRGYGIDSFNYKIENNLPIVCDNINESIF